MNRINNSYLGDDGIRMKALEIVLEKLLDDPHHDSIPSVNYLNEKNSSSNEIQSFNDRKFIRLTYL